MILISLCFNLICEVYGIELNSLKFLTYFSYSYRNKKSTRDSLIQVTRQDHRSPGPEAKSVILLHLRSQNTTFRWFEQQKSASSHFWWLEVPDSGVGRVVFPRPLRGQQTLPSCVCSQLPLSPLRAGFPDTSVFRLPLLVRTPVRSSQG